MVQSTEKQIDDTLRGQFRRRIYKLYKKLKIFIDSFLNLAIIHCSKFSLFCLFFVASTNGATVFNAILFILFLSLSTVSYKHVRTVWKITIFVTSGIIVSMYTVDALKINFSQNYDQLFMFIGLSNQNKRTLLPSYFGKYTSYLLLLLVLAFTYHIIHSQSYEKFLKMFQNLEQSSNNNADESNEPQTSVQSPNFQMSQADSLTRIIIQYSLYLTITALFIECVLLPINALNLALIILMTILIIQFLRSDSLIKFYESVGRTMIVLKWASTVLIFLKYMFQFEDYFSAVVKEEIADSESADDWKYYFEQLPMFKRLMGMENSFVPVKLFSLALVMSLTNLQSKFLLHTYLKDILRSMEQDLMVKVSLKRSKAPRLKQLWHTLSSYAIFFSVYLIKPLPALFLIMYAVKQPSLQGAAMILISLRAICNQINENHRRLWNAVYQTIGVTASISLLVIYASQFIMNCLSTNSLKEAFQLIRWLLGFPDQQNSWYIDKPLVPLFMIIVVCAAHKALQRYELEFKITLTQESLNDSLDIHSPINDGKSKLQKHFEMQAKWEQEAPLRTCLKIKDYANRFIINGGIIVLQVLILLAAFLKLNINSLILCCLFIKINRVRYLKADFQAVMKLLKTTTFAVSGIIVFQYLMMIKDNDLVIVKRFTSWKLRLSEVFCKDPQCQLEWRQWLSIDNVQPGFIKIDFLIILLAVVLWTYEQAKIEEEIENNETSPKLNDENDFLSYKNELRHSLLLMLKIWIFKGFPYLLISYIAIYAATDNGTDLTDFGTSIYLLIALYYVVNFRKLYTQNSYQLRYLRLYNIVMVIAYVAFQSPIFLCPAVESQKNGGASTYIGLERCVKLQKKYFGLVDRNEDESLEDLNAATEGNSLIGFYIILIHSLGFYKVQQPVDDYKLSFLFLVALTEIQDYIFNHSYFQTYVLQHMQQDRQTDGKLRAFMFVESTHLNKLWAYKAIKEEIKILHSRLLRITQSIKQSEHSRHLLLDDDNEHQNPNSSNERQSLISNQSSDNLSLSEGIDNHPTTQPDLQLDSQTQEKLDAQFNKLLIKNANDIENIALDLLQRPGTPVVPLKLFMAAWKNFLQNKYLNQVREAKCNANEETKEVDDVDPSYLNPDLINEKQPDTPLCYDFKLYIDQDDIEEYLLQIAMKLQRQVELKGRTDLLYQKGIGLNYAIQKGSDSLLKEGDYIFYHHLILSKNPNSMKHDESVKEAEEEEDADSMILNAEPTFDIKKDYEDVLLIVSTFKEAERKKVSLLKKLNVWFRSYIWTKYINKHLFYSLSHSSHPDKNEYKISLYSLPILNLIGYCILSQSQSICYAALFINFIANADILSLILPLSVLFYALFSNPIPGNAYWKFLMIYELAVIFAKFMYQLPIICGTPAFTLFSFDKCNMQPIPPEVLVNRIDYIIGLHKYSGPASYPQDQGILVGITSDLIVLLTLLVHKNYLIKIGLWHYIRIKNSIYDTPSFKNNLEDLNESERAQIIQKKLRKMAEYQSKNTVGKVKHWLGRGLKNAKCFILRLLPVYMENYQKNRDLRTLQDEPRILHNVKCVKPGKDFFNQSFFSLLLILVFNLFFYRSVTGDSHSSAISTANLQRFSIPQVAILFLLLLLLMVERMLYRVRQIDSQSAYANSGILGKHQLTIKLIIHVVLVIYVHVELCFFVPKYNNMTFDRKFPLILMYLLWVYYFVSSALQIKHGYPQAPFKAPFIRDTSYFTVWVFRIYKAMPFLWEMKVIIDWTVTSTCLDLYQWFKLDDAFNYLYQCQVQNYDRARRVEYAQRPWYEKFFQGFCFAFALILVILAPILLFSGINPIMVNNPVLSGQMQMSIELNQNGNSYSILQTQAFHIQPLKKSDLDSLQSMFVEGSSKFELQNMQKMYFSPYSEIGWQISPPSLQKFIDDYNSIMNDTGAFFDIKVRWIFKRDNPIGNEQAIQDTRQRMAINTLQPIIDALSIDSGKTTHKMNDINSTESTILVENIFPKLLKLGDTQQSHIMDVIPIQANVSVLGSARLSLNHGGEQPSKNSDNQYSSQLYWTYKLLEEDQTGIFDGKQNDDDTQTNMVLIVSNEQVIGSLFGTALQLSVVGLYATIVIAIGRFLRLAFDRISQRVIYEEMDPETTEQLFEICEGIYIAQLEGDLVKEKKLYDLLIRMYRSPETLIRVNRAAAALRNHERDEALQTSLQHGSLTHSQSQPMPQAKSRNLYQQQLSVSINQTQAPQKRRRSSQGEQNDLVQE